MSRNTLTVTTWSFSLLWRLVCSSRVFSSCYRCISRLTATRGSATDENKDGGSQSSTKVAYTCPSLSNFAHFAQTLSVTTHPPTPPTSPITRSLSGQKLLRSCSIFSRALAIGFLHHALRVCSAFINLFVSRHVSSAEPVNVCGFRCRDLISKASRRKLGTGRRQRGVEIFFRSPRKRALWQMTTLEQTHATGAIVMVCHAAAAVKVINPIKSGASLGR